METHEGGKTHGLNFAPELDAAKRDHGRDEVRGSTTSS